MRRECCDACQHPALLEGGPDALLGHSPECDVTCLTNRQGMGAAHPAAEPISPQLRSSGEERACGRIKMHALLFGAPVAHDEVARPAPECFTSSATASVRQNAFPWSTATSAASYTPGGFGSSAQAAKSARISPDAGKRPLGTVDSRTESTSAAQG